MSATRPHRTVQPYQDSYLAPAFEHATVADAMHPGVLACDPGASLTEVAQLMAEHDVHHLVVVGGADPRPVGILSSLDVAGVLAWGRA